MPDRRTISGVFRSAPSHQIPERTSAIPTALGDIRMTTQQVENQSGNSNVLRGLECASMGSDYRPLARCPHQSASVQRETVHGVQDYSRELTPDQMTVLRRLRAAFPERVTGVGAAEELGCSIRTGEKWLSVFVLSGHLESTRNGHVWTTRGARRSA